MDSDIVAFLCDGIGLFTIGSSNNNLYDKNFHEDDSETIVHVKLRRGIIDLNKLKHVEKISVMVRVIHKRLLV